MEVLAMIFEGGPWAERYIAPPQLEWPLPDKVKAQDHPEGHYHKVYQSKGEAKKGSLRGARYEWVEEPFS